MLWQFLEDCLERVPDLYLDELRQLLLDECGVEVGSIEPSHSEDGHEKRYVLLAS
jgi:hypothetical protein